MFAFSPQNSFQKNNQDISRDKKIFHKFSFNRVIFSREVFLFAPRTTHITGDVRKYRFTSTRFEPVRSSVTDERIAHHLACIVRSPFSRDIALFPYISMCRVFSENYVQLAQITPGRVSASINDDEIATVGRLN